MFFTVIFLWITFALCSIGYNYVLKLRICQQLMLLIVAIDIRIVYCPDILDIFKISEQGGKFRQMQHVWILNLGAHTSMNWDVK